MPQQPERVSHPLSAAQSGMWFAQQLAPESAAYSGAQCVEIHGPVDATRFETAVRRTVAEADTLHARVTDGAEGPRQTLDPDAAGRCVVTFVDLSGAADPEAAARAWMNDELNRPFTPADAPGRDPRDPLMCEALLRLAPDRHFWYQRIHHVLVDGYGFALLTRRVAELYTALGRAGAEDERSPFGTLAELLTADRDYRASDGFARDRAYWTERLADCPRPVQLSGADAPVSSGFLRATTVLPPEYVDRFTDLVAGYGLSWSDAIVAAAAVYTQALTGADDLTLGIPVAARVTADERDTPGMVSNVLPLRVSLRPGTTLGQLIGEVARSMRGLLRHQRYRVEDIRRDLGLVGGQQALYGPVVNIMRFAYDLRFDGHRATVHNVSNGPVENLSFSVYARSDGSGVRIDVDTNPALYTQEETTAHRDRFVALLERLLAAGPAQSVGRLDVVTEAERSLVLEGWNDSASVVEGLTFPELFEERVARAPESVALVCGDVELSYAELNARANRLARVLVGRGVGPESVVALVLPRSVEFVVGMLGVLKAGGAYVPVDPEYPRERVG
ncbi:condensation domain-containing protein, partial [Streptomyces sp. NPDC047725]|uniref:condensation domain-containing protein n=1 Tax=Streptomyces sp. NPDC047725 TaxID=3365487 RepID=UPI003718C2B5